MEDKEVNIDKITHSIDIDKKEDNMKYKNFEGYSSNKLDSKVGDIVYYEMQKIEFLEKKNKAERALIKANKRISELESEVEELRKKIKDEKRKTQTAIKQKKQKELLLLAKIEKIQRMENWSSLRLGRALLACHSFKGIAHLPVELWNLYKRRMTREQRSAPLQVEADPHLFASNIEVTEGQEKTFPRKDLLNSEQQEWIKKSLENASKIPDSNGCRFYKKSDLRIGLICDEFFYDSISAAADFIYVTPDNWREKLEEGFDAFLYVSTWRGVHDEWKGAASLSVLEQKYYEMKLAKEASEEFSFGKLGTLRDEIVELLDECHMRHIPTVFYSKEDPPNYWIFIEIAKHCDYVFTSAKECVDAYKTYCGHNRVEAVSFGINPQIHNPIGIHNEYKKKDIIFSGSWMKKYPERCDEISKIFEGVLSSGYSLHIIDRNYPHNKNYLYPEHYIKYVSPALPHDILQKVHKTSNWAININTVKNSETMFANRAFELQANGVLMISNYSIGINSLLPNIFMIEDSSEVGAILNCFTEEERYERQVSGVRSVMTGHTCYDRLSKFLAPTGLQSEQPLCNILVLADEINEHVQDCFNRQTYEHKILCNISNVTEYDINKFDMVTWFDYKAEYEEFYLEDMINAFKYTSCDYVTKDAWYEGNILHHGVEHNYVSKMTSKYRTVFWRESFSFDDLLNMKENVEIKNGYSIDHFNFNSCNYKKIITKKNILCPLLFQYIIMDAIFMESVFQV